MKSSETSGNAGPYPTGASFSELLNWHMTFGTRPGGSPDRPGKRWMTADFAHSVLLDSSETPMRNVANWRAGKNKPSNFDRIELSFFGATKDGISDTYSQWRLDLRIAYDNFQKSADSDVVREPRNLLTGPIQILNDSVDATLKAVTPLTDKLLAAELWGNETAWASVRPGRITDLDLAYVIAAEVAAAALRDPDTRDKAQALMRLIPAERRWRDDPVGLRQANLVGSFTIQNTSSLPMMIRMEATSEVPFQAPEWKVALQERLPPNEPLLVPKRSFVEVSTHVFGGHKKIMPNDKEQYDFEAVLRIAPKWNFDFSDMEVYPKDNPDIYRGALSWGRIDGVQEWAASDALRVLMQGGHFEVPITLQIDGRREERKLSLRVDTTRTNADVLDTLRRIHAPDDLRDFLERWLAVMRGGCQRLWDEHHEIRRMEGRLGSLRFQIYASLAFGSKIDEDDHQRRHEISFLMPMGAQRCLHQVDFMATQVQGEVLCNCLTPIMRGVVDDFQIFATEEGVSRQGTAADLLNHVRFVANPKLEERADQLFIRINELADRIDAACSEANDTDVATLQFVWSDDGATGVYASNFYIASNGWDLVPAFEQEAIVALAGVATNLAVVQRSKMKVFGSAGEAVGELVRCLMSVGMGELAKKIAQCS